MLRQERALDAVTVSGLYMEPGVFSGTTINHIAAYVGPGTVVHGFDSFLGLPESWGPAKKGTFDREGVPPEVRENVRLHAGWLFELIDTTGPAFEHIAYTDRGFSVAVKIL